MDSTVCLGVTKSGSSCRAKAGSSGYCPIHDPTKIAEREKEQQAREAVRQIAQARRDRLQEVIDVIKATCKRKGWKANLQHFDDEAGQYASLEVSRSFRRENYSSETVIGTLDVTLTQRHWC